MQPTQIEGGREQGADLGYACVRGTAVCSWWRVAAASRSWRWRREIPTATAAEGLFIFPQHARGWWSAMTPWRRWTPSIDPNGGRRARSRGPSVDRRQLLVVRSDRSGAQQQLHGCECEEQTASRRRISPSMAVLRHWRRWRRGGWGPAAVRETDFRSKRTELPNRTDLAHASS